MLTRTLMPVLGRPCVRLDAAQAQSLTCPNTSSVQTGAFDYWLSLWFRPAATSGSGSSRLMTKTNTGSNTQDYVCAFPGDTRQPSFNVIDGGFTAIGSASGPAGVAPGVWHHFFGYYNAATSRVGLVFDGVAATEGVASGTPGSTTQAVRIGTQNNAAATCFSGDIASVMFGKNPPGGFAATPAAAMAAALYGGRLRPREVSPAQITAWGLTAGWLDGPSFADVIGGNTLAPVGTPTFVGGF